MIHAGDTIKNFQEEDVLVTEVIRGRFGLLVNGEFRNHAFTFQGYLPFELPPSEEEDKWQGWASRAYITLGSGLRLASVCVSREVPDSVSTIDWYDQKWLETNMPAEVLT